MADLTSSIKIILSGGDTVAAGLRDISGPLGNLGGIATGLTKPFADLAKYVEILDAAIVGLATVAIVKSTKEAATFESSLFDLQKQLDSTEGSARDQAGALEEMAQKYGVNANDLVKSTADFKAAGYDLDTSLKLVKGSLDLMIAGGVKSSEAVDIMNRSLAGFQVPASQVVTEATHMGDVINKTADITKSSFVEISRGFADFSPIAKLTGLSVEETSAIMSKVIDVFGSGSEAANSLKSGFISLVTPSSEASAELLKLGVSVTDSAGKFRSTKDILADLAPAFAKLTDAEKLHAAGVIFGTHQAGKFVQVLSTYSDAMALAKRLTDEAGGSIEKEVTIRLQAAEVQFNRTAEAIRQLEVHFGLQFLESVSGASGGITDLTNAFKQLVDNNAFAPFIDLIKSGANTIGDTLRAMAKNLPQAFAAVDFSGLLSGINDLGKELGTLFKAFFGDIDLTTVEGLSSAIQTVVNSGESLVRTTQGIVKAFEPFAEAVGSAAREFNKLSESDKVDFGSFIGDMQSIVKAGGLASSAIIALGTAFKDLERPFEIIGGVIKIFINVLQISFDSLAYLVLSTLTSIGDVVGGVVDITTDAFSSIYSTVSGIIHALMAAFDSFEIGVLKVNEGILNAVKTYHVLNGDFESAEINNKALDGLRKDIDALTGSLQKNSDAMRNDFSAALYGSGEGASWFSQKIQGLREYSNATIENMKRNAGDLKDGFNMVMGEAGDKTENLSTKVKQLKTNSDDLYGGVRTASDGILNEVNRLIDWATGASAATKSLTSDLGDAQKSLIVKGDISFNDEPIKNLKKTWDEYGNPVFTQIGTGAIKATGVFASVSDAAAKQTKAIDDAVKKSQEYQLKMEEIASNERIKTIEANVKLNVAELEAQTKQVEAAFKSIDTTISSTGDLLGSLFGNLASADTYTKLQIEDQIELENQRRQKALDLQTKLTEAEIEKIQAQTDALNRGDGTIKINAEGMEPEIKAFMYKILKLIRIETSRDVSNYLLGLNPA